ncbi:hypothetical protein [Serratia sp. UGAL515B_01]|uniref:hypothetical protein n=1 Tax=Serratia sp. UGAL515B_01 TaxID=2986763 RepID=UPI00295494E6|nr:hypothetical protein [Serratia sp. UGAL515B_01]WON77443.1 hypothetical protein OK023_01650 [Serratia sp. UGAL515B_01]
MALLLLYLLGIIAQKIMFKLNPYKESLFSFNLHWYYELKGKVEKSKNADFIKMTFMVEVNGSAYLYSGILENSHLNPDGILERIVISDVTRVMLHKNYHKSRTARINLDRMIMRYSEIKSITIEYLVVVAD